MEAACTCKGRELTFEGRADWASAELREVDGEETFVMFECPLSFFNNL